MRQQHIEQIKVLEKAYYETGNMEIAEIIKKMYKQLDYYDELEGYIKWI